MDRETEMYHAAIRIMQNRAAQCDDYLMHAYGGSNVTVYDKDGNLIGPEQIYSIIDAEIDNLPPSTIGILSNVDFSKDSYKKASRDGIKEKAATQRLWNLTHKELETALVNDLKALGVSNADVNKGNAWDTMVTKRMKERFNTKL